MVISKGSYVYGEVKNVFPYSVQKQYLSVRGHKLPLFMGGSIRPRMEICETSSLPIGMVQRFHSRNLYIKRNLREPKNVLLLSVEKPHLPMPGLQTTPFHEWQYGAENGNMRNFGPTSPHGTAFAPKQWLYQKEAIGMESS